MDQAAAEKLVVRRCIERQNLVAESGSIGDETGANGFAHQARGDAASIFSIAVEEAFGGGGQRFDGFTIARFFHHQTRKALTRQRIGRRFTGLCRQAQRFEARREQARNQRAVGRKIGGRKDIDAQIAQRIVDPGEIGGVAVAQNVPPCGGCDGRQRLEEIPRRNAACTQGRFGVEEQRQLVGCIERWCRGYQRAPSLAIKRIAVIPTPLGIGDHRFRTRSADNQICGLTVQHFTNLVPAFAFDAHGDTPRLRMGLAADGSVWGLRNRNGRVSGRLAAIANTDKRHARLVDKAAK